jgi:hypothetical protein
MQLPQPIHSPPLNTGPPRPGPKYKNWQTEFCNPYVSIGILITF